MNVCPFQLTLCSCETVWKEAAFLFLCLVRVLESLTEEKKKMLAYIQASMLSLGLFGEVPMSERM